MPDTLAAFLSSPRSYLTDGGLETSLIFHDGFDLPLFAAFVLYDSPEGRAALVRYFTRYLDIAAADDRGFLLDTATWRANAGWGPKLGFRDAALRSVNRRAVALAADLRASRGRAHPVLINGVIGPAGDGYRPEDLLTADRAEALHCPQIEAFADAGADMATAMTLTHTGEAIGLAWAAVGVGLPLALSFTVETNGRLPDGTPLGEAIATVDAATHGSPLYYGINCAHPTHFLDQLHGDWTGRIGLVRANASRMSHAELDETPELDDGDPEEFGALYRLVAEKLPGVRALGGCCGTDHRHVGAVTQRQPGP